MIIFKDRDEFLDRFKKIQPYQVKTVDNKLLVHAKHEESGGGLKPMMKILFMNNMTQENQSTVSTTGSFCFRQVKNHQEPTKNYNFLNNDVTANLKLQISKTFRFF